MTLHSITATYPGFQALPKGIKQMLLVSESVFFDEARAPQKTTQVHRPQVITDSYSIPPEVILMHDSNEQAPQAGLRAP
jgi:hypothetical protein